MGALPDNDHENAGSGSIPEGVSGVATEARRRAWRGAAGILTGAVVGYFAFHLLLRYGLIALALPGVCVGLGRMVFLRDWSWRMAMAAALVALALGLFIADGIYADGLKGALNGFAGLNLAAGSLLAFWFALGRER
jgi:hypothetical protein